MNFEKQVAQAHNLTFRENRAYQGKSNVGESYDDLNFLNQHIENQITEDALDLAYKADSGYSLVINPETGKREMYIAGTRSTGQWILNAVDTVSYNAERYLGKEIRALYDDVLPGSSYLVPNFKYADPWRVDKEEYYADIAKELDVDVVYGHSRGGALVADLDIDAEKVGLDAAMIMAEDQNMINLNEGGNLFQKPEGVFDYLIGLGGKKNVFKKSRGFHSVWKN